MIPAIFITGIPTAGKSFLSRKLARDFGGYCLETDTLRKRLASHPQYGAWVNFFLDQDEYAYYASNDYEMQWQNLVRQSEEIWPAILEEIEKYRSGDIPVGQRLSSIVRRPLSDKRPIIVEGVTVLPHLAHRDLSFPGIVLIGKSPEQTLERLMKKPRWGESEELQKMEADAFWYGERPHYQIEAERYGYEIFGSAEEAYPRAVEMLKNI